MGNTASLANEDDPISPTNGQTNPPKTDTAGTTTMEANNNDEDGEEDTAGTAMFNLGDSFSLSKEGGDKSSSNVFIPRYTTNDEEQDTDTAGTFTDTGEGDTTSKGSLMTDGEIDETIHTNNTENDTIGELSLGDPPTDNAIGVEPKYTATTNNNNYVEENSLLTDMAQDGDDEATNEKRRPGRRVARKKNQAQNKNIANTTTISDPNDDESIQILDAEEEFSHILQYTTHSQDMDDDLMLLKAQHQKHAKISSVVAHIGSHRKKRQQQEPPDTFSVMKDHQMMIPVIVEGIDTDTEHKQFSESRHPNEEHNQNVIKKYPILGMSEIQNVVGLSTRRERRPNNYDTKSMMIVVASDIDPTKNKAFFNRISNTDKDSLFEIPYKNLIRESRNLVVISGSDVSVASADAIDSNNHDVGNTLFDENDIRETMSDDNDEDDDNEESQCFIHSPSNQARVPSSSSPLLPHSPLSDTKMVGQLLKAHDDGPSSTTNTLSELPTSEIDMKIVTRFVQTFNSFLRKHRQFDSLDQTTIDALRVLKLQKLLTTLSEVESELEEFILSTQTQKQLFSLDYHTKLVECNKKKASRKIELLRSFEELRHATSDLEKNLYWELILAFEARAKREYDLRKSLSTLNMMNGGDSLQKKNLLNLLPDAQAPAIQKILWTEEFRLDEINQLQIENAFLRAEVSILEKKLSHLVDNSKHDSWVDAVFRRINDDQLNLLKERHEAPFAMTRHSL